MAGRIAWIAYAPVKGLGLVQPEEIVLEKAGLRENRRFYLVTDEGRLVNGKLVGSLVQIVAEADSDGTALSLRFPDGSEVAGEAELGEAIETNYYGRRMVAGRVVEGPWSRALSDFAGIPLRLVRADEVGDGSDRGAEASVSLVGTASLARLAAEAGVGAPVDGRRFRLLFGVDGIDAHAEDDWLGRDVAVGGSVLHFNEHVGRCAVTTHNPDTGAPDLDTLRLIRDYRGAIPSVEPLPFGIWGEVVEPGRVRVGDPVAALDA